MDKISVNYRIKDKLFLKFKLLCTYEGCSMTERINKLIEQDVQSYEEDKHIKLHIWQYE